jgi:hypothetical protein
MRLHSKSDNHGIPACISSASCVSACRKDRISRMQLSFFNQPNDCNCQNVHRNQARRLPPSSGRRTIRRPSPFWCFGIKNCAFRCLDGMDTLFNGRWWGSIPSTSAGPKQLQGIMPGNGEFINGYGRKGQVMMYCPVSNNTCVVLRFLV